MKFFTHILYVLYATAAVAAAAGLCACSEIKDGDRFIELPPIEAQRVVLIEEYTGQNCANCPRAHEAIASLLAQYQGNLISVSFHGGYMAMSENDFPQIGLGNDQSEAYFTASGAKTPPQAVINRNTGAIAEAQWAAAVRKQAELPSYIDMEVSAHLNTTADSIIIDTHLLPHEVMDANLQIWVTESGIIGYQLFETGISFEYEHNHVFRAAVNGMQGEPVQLKARTDEHYTHRIALRDDDKCKWNKDKLSVVAFVYDADGVQQAAQGKVGE